ncbi:MAG: DUF4309 domain-containing protein [Acidaminococcaceae bacterium]|nr:DUF4309 domain-containing protein [Acidaminococcaceae bacterium]
MKVKKLLAASLTALAISVSVPCFAQIPSSIMIIGGLYIGQSFSEVISVYGKPVAEREPAGRGMMYTFTKNGASFDVRICNDKVSEVAVNQINGPSTISGIKIGSTPEEVTKTYGKPDVEEKFGDEYVMSYNSKVSNEFTWILSFVVKNGKVIRLGLDEVMN